MADLSVADKRLGAVLLERGDVLDEGLQRAMARQADTGERLTDALIATGVCDEERITQAIEATMGIPLVRLTRRDVDPDALASIPAELADRLGVLPFERDGHRLKVAFRDPLDTLALEEIEDASGCVVNRYQAFTREIAWAIATHYPALGLKAPSDVSSEHERRVGALALEKGWIGQEQLDAANDALQEGRGRIGRILIEQGALDETQLAQLLAEQVDLPFEPALDDPLDAALTLALLRVDAVQYDAVPLRKEGDVTVVAVADPHRMGAVEGIVPGETRFVVATESAVQERVRDLYGEEAQRLGDTLLLDKKLRREQLRRALEEQANLGTVKPLGEILVDLGYVTQAEVDAALDKQRIGGGQLEDTLVQSGSLAPDMLARSLAMQLGYEYVDESSVQVDPYVVSLVPESTARRYGAMPLRLEDDVLVVAMKDPRHVFALDDMSLITGKEIRPAVATEEALTYLLNRFYRSDADMDELATALLEEVGGRASETEEDTSAIDENALVKVVNNIIREAIISDFSDVHVEPRPDRVLVRVRKDGTLREYMTMPKATAGALIARIKIMGGLNIAERRVPQDGRIRFKDRTTEVDLRLSTLPTVYGEKAVMRLLKKASSIPEIEQLGFAEDVFTRFEDVIRKPYGMFLITGPTGSGKSFTSFSILKRVATPDVNVSTIEDPVEYEIPGINQTQVNMKAGLDFARALRSFLRQDPDIIMVGEIRDHETAKIAMEAALTGHLLIATLHTNDAAGAITRLTEMGIEPFNVSASLIGVLAQRLVRRVCTKCKVEYTPDPDVLRRLGLADQDLSERTLVRGVGCEACGGTGFDGRYAIHELLVVDDEVEAAIVQEASALELHRLAVSKGMHTLREDGIAKAFQGITTLEEVLARTAE